MIKFSREISAVTRLSYVKPIWSFLGITKSRLMILLVPCFALIRNGIYSWGYLKVSIHRWHWDLTANRLYPLSLPAPHLSIFGDGMYWKKVAEKFTGLRNARITLLNPRKEFPLGLRWSEDYYNGQILLYSWGNDLSGNTDGLSAYLRDAGGQIYRLTSSHRLVISDRFELCYYETRATGCQQTAWLRRRWSPISEESHMVGGHGHASHRRGC